MNRLLILLCGEWAGASALWLCLLTLLQGVVAAQDYEHHEDIAGAVLYDHNPATSLGDDVFGNVVADFGDPTDRRLRCSHGGPVCMEYANGTLAAFYANTSSHNVDGWSEYAISRDRGRTWDKYHPFPYSHDAYQRDPKRPVWVEEGLVTDQGAAVLFLTHFENGNRVGNSLMRSHDHGATWSDPEPLGPSAIGYPAAVALGGPVNYVLFDSLNGDHELYVSTDDGKTWGKRSSLPLQKDAWYGVCALWRESDCWREPTSRETRTTCTTASAKTGAARGTARA